MNRSFRWITSEDFDVDAYLLESGQWYLFVIGRSSFGGSELRKIAESFTYGEVAVVGGAIKAPNAQKSVPAEPFYFSSGLESLVAIEGLDRFLLEAKDVLNPGLFLDQAANREYLREQSLSGAGGLLNLFCYTSSFSVNAAKRGITTTNVDVSSRYLKWSRKNFEINSVDCANHRFVKADARHYVRKLKRRGERFSWIVLDPPTFSRADGNVFQVKKDLPDLLEECLSVWDGSGEVLVSTNDSTWDRKDFDATVRRIAGGGARCRPIVVSKEFGREYPLKGLWISRRDRAKPFD